jgi:hypothetical protein
VKLILDPTADRLILDATAPNRLILLPREMLGALRGSMRIELATEGEFNSQAPNEGGAETRPASE